MDFAPVRKLAVLFISILCAIMISRIVSGVILTALGLSGISAFIVGFILYAVVFFGILYLFERFTGVSVFSFGSR